MNSWPIFQLCGQYRNFADPIQTRPRRLEDRLEDILEKSTGRRRRLDCEPRLDRMSHQRREAGPGVAVGRAAASLVSASVSAALTWLLSASPLVARHTP